MVAFVDEVFGSEGFVIEVEESDAVFFLEAVIAVVAVALLGRAVCGGFGDDDLVLYERFEEFKDAFEAAGVGGGELVVDVYEVGFDNDGLLFGESFADLGFDEFQCIIDIFWAGIAGGECDACGWGVGVCRAHEEGCRGDAGEGVLQK